MQEANAKQTKDSAGSAEKQKPKNKTRVQKQLDSNPIKFDRAAFMKMSQKQKIEYLSKTNYNLIQVVNGLKNLIHPFSIHALAFEKDEDNEKVVYTETFKDPNTGEEEVSELTVLNFRMMAGALVSIVSLLDER